jgi:hypothetical protein
MKNLLMLLFTFSLTVPGARADEGMWTLDNLPLKQLQERYHFTPTPDWLAQARLASVRFNDGGSGAFVSPNGLVITNHHVALGQLQKMSTAKKDYVQEGFFARRPAEEHPCPDLELNVLFSTQDVTTRVLSAIDAKASDAVQNDQRKAEISRIEKESFDQTKLRSDVVELYNGGQYQLYRYKKYTDVRLVMAAEVQAAFYGGDYDNFVFPRHDLDMAFFRVYEGSKPVKSPAYFKWSKSGAKDGELVFVSGHPGSTDRLKTIKQLEFERDYAFPATLKQFALRLATLAAYSARGPEPARRALKKVHYINNFLKAFTGELQGLHDPKLMAANKTAEDALRAAVTAKPELAFAAASWDRLAAVQDKLIARFKDLQYRAASTSSLRRADSTDSKLACLAQTIVRYVAEVEKPNEARYEEFRGSNLDSLRFQLFSPAPVYADLEEEMLAMDLKESLDQLGPDHPYVKAALGGKEPRTMAHELVSGTGLADPVLRQKLVAGGRKAVVASTDPMIVWARGLDPLYRELRKWREDEVESVEALEGNKLAKARFAILGTSAYPDATFTLRLSYGKVAGYEEGTTRVPCQTTFYGLYDRAASFANQPPFDLSALEAERKTDVDLSTPLDFVTTNDIIGGNSGSPVFNRDGEYVGLIFDGNIPGLVLRFAYSEERARAVAVHSSGIIEGLRKIYRMDSLADELTAP